MEGWIIFGAIVVAGLVLLNARGRRSTLPGPTSQRPPAPRVAISAEYDNDYGFEISVVGESFDNADGTSRQKIIKGCFVTDPISLRPEPTNRYDPHAIAVFHAKGQIGYIGRDHCARLRAEMDGGQIKKVEIANIVGGEPGKPHLGVILLVTKSS